MPEVNETVMIELYGAGGGSVMGRHDSVSIVILANDHVAGVLKFTVLSHIVKEGMEKFIMLSQKVFLRTVF